MRFPRPRAEAALLLLVAACATPQRAPAPPPVSSAPPGTAVKIGKPYQVFGKWYYPSDDRGYDARGVASWYGPGFHALSTANGEVYNQDDVTAAHKTLPMPSWVEVENLDNGRTLTVRINDRGPFVDGRIIDLSRRSAQLLGVDRVGLAQVRVRRVFPQESASVRPETVPLPVAPALLPPPPPAPPPPVPIQTVPVQTAPMPDPEVRTVELPGAAPAAPIPATVPAAIPAANAPAAALAGPLYVQVAALSDPGRIAWLKGFLGAFGPVVTQAAPGGLTRIRLGPYADQPAANSMLVQLRAAGYADARIVKP
ncbi:septal ring lytic transglycosylase RlpA family protein [Polymorphobacter sp.]|uniref:septal ring lytic transglycosylase RlpA family protein n=1 Tax=Polymorphobacter sp. TaxID=1909290 RepID=UPI003F707D25